MSALSGLGHLLVLMLHVLHRNIASYIYNKVTYISFLGWVYILLKMEALLDYVMKK